MPTRVKVIGAGSIGNHLAHGCRSVGWEVTIVDLNVEALERTRDIIYPNRYGSWDRNIRLTSPTEVKHETFDVVIVGTPPATHLSIAQEEVADRPPKILLIEKPLSHPNSDDIQAFLAAAAGSNTRILVGYNQRHKPNTHKFLEIARRKSLGKLTGLQSHMLESWDGILKAHFWMKSEKDSYLAFAEQGGGALLEHSHALNLLLYFASELGQGQAKSVQAEIEWIDHDAGRYDRDSRLLITFESGLVGEVRQDLHTWPAKKEAVATFEHGQVLWAMNEGIDSVVEISQDGSELERWDFPKTRPDDFRGEIEHVQSLLSNPGMNSSIDLAEGLSVMEVALSALESSASGTPSLVTPLEAKRR